MRKSTVRFKLNPETDVDFGQADLKVFGCAATEDEYGNVESWNIKGSALEDMVLVGDAVYDFGDTDRVVEIRNCKLVDEWAESLMAVVGRSINHGCDEEDTLPNFYYPQEVIILEITDNEG